MAPDAVTTGATVHHGLPEIEVVSRESAPALSVDGLCKSYDGATRAVDGVSLYVPRGSVVGLLGPNGAGKSTTIGCVSGLIRPDAGTIRMDGVAVDPRDHGVRARLGVATQDIALYPDLTARANLRFFARLAGGAARRVERNIRTTARALGLVDKLDHRVRDLSGGQQRLVHVAAAAVHRPSVLVLDEPTAGLDVRARSTMVDFIRQLAAGGTAILYSSHYLQELEELCDRVVIVNHGRVVTSGRVDDLVAHHGSGRIEIDIRGVTHRRDGVDVASAVASLGATGPIDDVRVLRPSLEAVFLRITGSPPVDADEVDLRS